MILGGADWELTTTWACQAPITKDYTLYVHFIDENGQMVSQADHLIGEQSNWGYLSSPKIRLQNICAIVISFSHLNKLNSYFSGKAVGCWLSELVLG